MKIYSMSSVRHTSDGKSEGEMMVNFAGSCLASERNTLYVSNDPNDFPDLS